MKRNSFTPLQINQSIQNIFKNYIFKYSKRKFVTGLTLIELLIVVVIIGVLATIMYPRFQTFRIRTELKEVPNTIQLILAGEKYYNFKIGAYFDWTAADADNFVYTSSAHGNAEVEHELNITLPRDVCEYWVDNTTTPGTWAIHFRKADNTAEDEKKVGECVIQTRNYTIESPYDKYLGYLE